VTKTGEPKIVKTCTYPLTALECVTTVITDLAVIDVFSNGLQLREVAPGVSGEEIQSVTQPKLIIPSKVPEMRLR
jgi:acyl CoA:acetate/3-ketoacid CoA transferase beta subunit